MKEHKHYHPIDLAPSILTGKHLNTTCELIYYYGCRPAVLHAWSKQLILSAEKDREKWRSKIARLGETVAHLLTQESSTSRDNIHFVHGVEWLWKSIADVRYNIMLRIAYQLHLSELVQKSIFQMLLLSAKHMKYEFEKHPMKIDIAGWSHALKLQKS